MLGHLGINVPDLKSATAYYDAIAPMIGFETFFANEDETAYRPAAGKRGTYLFLYPSTDQEPYSGERTGLQHLAFMVKRRSDVDRIHDYVLSTGGTVVHAPQEFPQYPPPYYATFWLDPFGMKLEAVCHYDAD